MDKPTPTGFHELTAVHASLSPVAELLDARRTLYQLAIDLLRPEPGSPLPRNVLDSPSVRGRIGKALASGDATLCDELVPLDAVLADGCRLPAGPMSIPVASRAEANALLADAVSSVGAELTRQTATGGPLRLLTETDGARFTGAVEVVAEGLRLARSVSPALVDDLLVHVALLGVVDPACTGTLASASSRSYPGLVLLSPPNSPIEAAEWLVHEAAHQKLFDLAITGSMLTFESDTCPPFCPTWPPAGRQWPLEQTLAAAHAYSCMAQFVEGIGDLTAWGVESGSLLPAARERAGIICAWLLDRGDYLGRDAHTLLAGMCGRCPARGPVRQYDERRSDDLSVAHTIGPDFLVRRWAGGDRVLVGRRSQPPELYFVTGGLASALETATAGEDALGRFD